MVFIPRRQPSTPAAPQLPASFLKAGFVPPEQARMRGGSKFKGLMLATEGRSDTGKTEFVMSAPGPGIILACDRGFDSVFDNQAPPPTRRSDFGVKTLQMPMATDFGSNKDYVPYYATFYKETMQAVTIPEARTVCIDGDNYTWDLQKLAEFGRLQGVFPQTKYADPTAARMSFYYRLWESGKIIICTNMMKDQWRNVVNPDGSPKLDKNGEQFREPTGDSEAMGFPKQEYLWSLRIRHLFKAPVIRKLAGKEIRTSAQWGLRITKCKANANLVGHELWGEDCCFAKLVETVYPHIPLESWGF